MSPVRFHASHLILLHMVGVASAAEWDNSVQNLEQSMYLSASPTSIVDLLSQDATSSRSSPLSTWTFKSAPGQNRSYLVINKGEQKYLDAAAHGIALWRHGGFLGDLGSHPENLYWRMTGVEGKPDVYCLFNVGKQMYLDAGADGKSLALWPGSEPVGRWCTLPLHLQWVLTRPLELPSAAEWDNSVQNLEQSMYLSASSNSIVDLLSQEATSSRSTPLSTWTFKSAPGQNRSYLVINKGEQKYLDAAAHGVALWRHGGFLGDLGSHPENLYWRMTVVEGKPDVYCLFNVGKQMYLDAGADGKSLALWPGSEPVGRWCTLPLHLQWVLTRPLDLP